MAKYKLKDASNESKFQELAMISHNLRYYSKRWKAEYGAVNRASMEQWQEKMDKWLDENVDYTMLTWSESSLANLKGGWVEKIE